VLAVGGAKAQTETDIKDLQAANGTTEAWVASIPASYPIDVKDAVVFGSDANSQVTNANVNKYDYIYFEVTNFASAKNLRIFFWDPSSNSRKDWYLRPVEGKDKVTDLSVSANVTGNGTYCVKIPSGARLQGAKTPWTSSPTEVAYFQFSKIYVIEPTDPLAGLKDILQLAIDKAASLNSFAKTATSWQALLDAKQAGEAELANPGDETSLTNATTAINDAIAGLKLAEGYVNLTKSMYHEWSGIEDNATITGNGGCDLVIGEIGNGGMVYGNSSVLWNQYAKIVNPKSLIILGTPAGITFGARTDCLEVGNGSEDPNGGSLTTVNLTIDENGIAQADLSAKASVRINAIKNGYGGAATITDLLVEYKPIAVAVGAAGYATFSADLNTKVAGTKAYAAKVNGSEVALTEVTEIPAGSAVIVETEGDYQFPVLNEAAAIEDNDLKVSDGTVAGDGTIYVLADGKNGVGFYRLKKDNKVPAGKAYLEITNNNAPEFLGFGGDVTGISATLVNSEKVNSEIFNLQGQRVAQPAKGLYIANGKKVIIK